MKYSRKNSLRRIDNENRAVLLGRFIAEQKATVRHAASVFSISKSTVHKDITTRLKEEDPVLFREVEKVLAVNKAERHLRGGRATKEKYEKIAHHVHPVKESAK